MTSAETMPTSDQDQKNLLVAGNSKVTEAMRRAAGGLIGAETKVKTELHPSPGTIAKEHDKIVQAAADGERGAALNKAGTAVQALQGTGALVEVTTNTSGARDAFADNLANLTMDGSVENTDQYSAIDNPAARLDVAGQAIEDKRLDAVRTLRAMGEAPVGDYNDPAKHEQTSELRTTVRNARYRSDSLKSAERAVKEIQTPEAK